MNKNFIDVIIREIIILFIIIAAGYLLEVISIFMFGEQLYLRKPFWNNPQFYLVWDNSIRENAQILKVLGYPFYSLVRFFFWFTRVLAKTKTRAVSLDETKVREILEDIIKEIKLRRKIDSVEYRPNHFWYIVRFYSPPNCIIPRNYIDDYINSEGKLGKDKIAECFFKITRKPYGNP